MIKRTTAVYHVLVVSILVLAHAVIPHIHFNKEIVITSSEYHADKHACDSNQHKHSTEENGETDFCLLKQVYLARSNDTDSGASKTDLLKTQNYFPFAFLALLNYFDTFCFTPQISVPNEIYVASFYSYLGSGNINSRGSPLA